MLTYRPENDWCDELYSLLGMREKNIIVLTTIRDAKFCSTAVKPRITEALKIEIYTGKPCSLVSILSETYEPFTQWFAPETNMRDSHFKISRTILFKRHIKHNVLKMVPAFNDVAYLIYKSHFADSIKNFEKPITFKTYLLVVHAYNDFGKSLFNHTLAM